MFLLEFVKGIKAEEAGKIRQAKTLEKGKDLSASILGQGGNRSAYLKEE